METSDAPTCVDLCGTLVYTFSVTLYLLVVSFKTCMHTHACVYLWVCVGFFLYFVYETGVYYVESFST